MLTSPETDVMREEQRALLSVLWNEFKGAVVKRVLDLVVSTTALLLFSPLLLICAIATLLEGPGPVLYRATRVGRNGHEFKQYKFRTMVADADKGPAITVDADPRITRVGWVLRRSKVDELPQLINVLRGEMSLVGPRPEDPRYVALYTPEQREVLSVLPGITSPASIRYRNEEAHLKGPDWETTYVKEIMPAKLALDLKYVCNRSFRHDVATLARTFLALFR